VHIWFINSRRRRGGSSCSGMPTHFESTRLIRWYYVFLLKTDRFLKSFAHLVSKVHFVGNVKGGEYAIDLAMELKNSFSSPKEFVQ